MLAKIFKSMTQMKCT